MITSFGESTLPVANAGHASWQRPHSVHENVSSTSFQVRSAIVPAPKRISSSGTDGVVEAQRLEPPARAGAPEPDVERGGDDVQVLGARQVGEERQDRQHVDPDEHALEHPRRRLSPNRCDSACETGDHDAGHSFEPKRDPQSRATAAARSRSSRSSPGSDRPRRGGCPRTAPAAAPCGSTARRATPTSTSTRRRRPAARTSPGGRATAASRAIDDPDHRDQDRRHQHQESPEDERVHQPGAEPLQQLALPEHDRGLVAHRARGTSPPRSTGARRPQQPDRKRDPPRTARR